MTVQKIQAEDQKCFKWRQNGATQRLFFSFSNHLSNVHKTKDALARLRIFSCCHQPAFNHGCNLRAGWLCEEEADCADEVGEQSGPSKLNTERHHGQLGQKRAVSLPQAANADYCCTLNDSVLHVNLSQKSNLLTTSLQWRLVKTTSF